MQIFLIWLPTERLSLEDSKEQRSVERSSSFKVGQSLRELLDSILVSEVFDAGDIITALITLFMLFERGEAALLEGKQKLLF